MSVTHWRTVSDYWARYLGSVPCALSSEGSLKAISWVCANGCLVPRGRWRWKQLASSSLWAQQSTARGYRQAQAAAGLCGTRGSGMPLHLFCPNPNCQVPLAPLDSFKSDYVPPVQHPPSTIGDGLWRRPLATVTCERPQSLSWWLRFQVR